MKKIKCGEKSGNLHTKEISVKIMEFHRVLIIIKLCRTLCIITDSSSDSMCKPVKVNQKIY